MKGLTVLVLAGVVLYFFLSKKKSSSTAPAAPPVATVDYGAMGGYDFGAS